MAGVSFIKEIAPYITKFAPSYHIAVVSPIIAQAILESAYGTSELAKNAHNYFGLKYRKGRCPTATGIYEKVGSEQNADGSYVRSAMEWCKFPSMEAGVQGYFDFINISNYKNLKGVTDPETYLNNIKADGYATSLEYVDNLMRVIECYDLTQYDKKEESSMSIPIKQDLANKANYGGTRAMSNLYLVIHYTGNDGDTDENNGKYFRNNVTKTSAHYFVDSDSITQTVPDNYAAYSVGGSKYNNAGGRLYGKATNQNTLNIELCDDRKDGKVYPTDKTIENTLYLVGVLMEKYNIPKDRVIRHYDVNGKPCPAYWTDDTKWKKEFWNKITSQSTPTASESGSNSSETLYRVRKSADDAKTQIGAYKTLSNAKKKADENKGYYVFDSEGVKVYPITETKTKTFTPYLVRVKITDLRIRKGAGTDKAIVGVIAPNVYTIVEEADGKGATKWGKLKSGAGWISLDFAEKVNG